MDKTKNMFHVVSHTHWDREWYLSFQSFRAGLVEMIDNLLTLLNENPKFKFMLDGQTVVIEDYLEIKPENEAALKQYIRDGRLSVGPWYVLPDEFLADGESLIRNLLIGHRIAEDMGRVMKVGYIPDTFGHIASLPQIFGGFGIDNAVLWRGLQSRQTEFLWEAPDGTKSFVVWLPNGYGNAYFLPEEPNVALKKLLDVKAAILEKAPESKGHFLVMNGVDHLAPQKNLLNIIKEVNKITSDKVSLSSLPEYIKTVRDKKIGLDKISGELIDPHHYFVHISGIHSSRIYQKQANEKIEDMLRSYAEPLAVLAASGGNSYPAGLLNKAWKLLIQNHAHDSICGCSTDEVHQDMDSRFKAASEIACEVIRKSLENICHSPDEQASISIFNPLNHVRTELVDAVIDLPPGHSYRPELFDSNGNHIPIQTKYLGKKRKCYFYPGSASRKTPSFQMRYFWEISFIAENMRPLAFAKFIIKTAADEDVEDQAACIGKAKNCLENEYLRVKVNFNGTFNLLDKKTGVLYENLHYFEDSGDSGDGYNYSPPLNYEILTSENLKADISMIENGPLKAAIEIVLKFPLPVELGKNRQFRKTQTHICVITSKLILKKRSRRLDIETSVKNNIKDHRLRMALPVGGHSGYSYAGAHFSVQKRAISASDYPNFKKEADFGLRHQRYFMDSGKEGKKLAVCAKGLPQYQVDKEGTIYLTLLRAVGSLVREDLLSMKRSSGHIAVANWPTPDAQCQRTLTFNYAIIPHSGSWEEIVQDSFCFRMPPLPFQGDPGISDLINIEGKNIYISAMKKAETGDFIVLRFYNLSDSVSNARLKSSKKISKVKLMNFNEEFLNEVNMAKPVFPMKPYEIKTIGIWT